MILLVETSEQNCSVALFGCKTYKNTADQKPAVPAVIAQQSRTAPRQHADLLITLINSVLEQSSTTSAELIAIAVVSGPGAFTGIRIGISMVQGLAYGWGLPCIAVNTLELWAWSGIAQNPDWQLVLCLMDARMGQVYASAYTPSYVAKLAPCCVDPKDLDFNLIADSLFGNKVGVVGSGFAPYEADIITQAALAQVKLEVSLNPICFHSFGLLAFKAFNEGKSVQPAQLDGLYLRPAVSA